MPVKKRSISDLNSVQKDEKMEIDSSSSIVAPPNAVVALQGLKGKIKDPKLASLSAAAVAKEIEHDPDSYISALADIPSEYLKMIFEKLSYSALSKFLDSKKYREIINFEILNKSMTETENGYRKLFATHRENSLLSDPFLMLINVFDNENIFQFTEGDEIEQKIPRIFPNQNKKTIGPAIASRDQFVKNFAAFSENQLSEIDWSNVFVAGGSVLTCLQPLPPTVNLNSKTSLREYFQEGATFYPSGWSRWKMGSEKKLIASDIDIFIYGLSPREATEKLKKLYNQIRESNPHKMLTVRTPQSVTFVTQFPFRHIQVILRCYKSPAEVLMGFDIDCCCVGYDGKNVWGLPRFHRAVTRQYNLIDLGRRSTTYESRLMKYSYRGFEVALYKPEFFRDKIHPKIYNKSYKASGLALLLRFEKFSKFAQYWQLYDPETEEDFANENASLNAQSQMFQKLPSYFRSSFSTTAPKLIESKVEADKILEVKGDYSSTFLPWGPRWNAERVSNLLYRNSMSMLYCERSDLRSHTYGWEIEKVLTQKPGGYGDEDEDEDEKEKEPEDIILDRDETDKVLKQLPTSIKWLTVEPGRQFIGSFHPVPADDWDKDVYK